MSSTRLLRAMRAGFGAIGLATLACGSASGQVQNVAPVPAAGITSMAVANNRIYYSVGVFAQEFCTAYKQVWSLPTTGTPAATLLDSATNPPVCDELWVPIVPSGAHIYGAFGRGVHRVFAQGGEPTQTVIPATTITPIGFAVDQFRVYVESPDNVLTAYPRDGGAPVGSISVPGLTGGSMQAPGDGFVYYIANGNIFKWSGINSTQIPLETSSTVANVIWVDATDVWWVGATGTTQTIGRIPVGGGANTVRHTALAGTDIYALTGDANNIYFAADPPGSGLDVIRRLPRASTTATDINDLSSRIFTLQQDEQFLYWVEGGNIKRNLKNATIARPDLTWSQDRLEVIQAVQDDQNSVGLVAGRPTLVRAYPVATQAIKTVGAWLEGTTTGGTPLPGSPIRAMSLWTDVGATAPDRGEFKKSFNFILPDSWVAAGAGTTTSIRLRAVIDPVNFVAESSETNNATTTQTFTFHKTDTLVVDCRRVLTITDYTVDSFNFDEIVRRAHSMLPFTQIVTREVPGRLEEWEPTLLHPLRTGPWELNGKHWECAWLCNEDDWVVFVLGLEWALSEIPNALFGPGVRLHRMGMVSPISDWEWGGLAPTFANPLLVKMSGSVFFRDIDDPYGGTAMAHELTHNFGFQHVKCGSGFRGGFDENYPYDPCDMGPTDTGPTRTLAFDWLRKQLYDAPSLHSYMSYEDNGWTEPYHWNSILNSVQLRGPGGFPASSEALMVMGVYDPVTGAATVTAARRLDRASVPTANLDELWGQQNASTTTNSLPLNVELLNGSDQRIDSVIVQVPRPCCALHTDPRPFEAIAPCSSSVRGVRVSPLTSASGTVVPGPAFHASAHAPTVTVTAPAAGTNFTASQPIAVSWTASDADGEPLSVTIQYSRDGGTTWTAVATAPNTGSSTFAATDRLPGSASLAGNGSSLFRVIASDGFNTTSALSAAFKVPNRAPRVAITSPASGASVPASEQILVEANASDPEDMLVSSFTWTSLHNGVTTSLGSTSLPRLLISNGLAPGVWVITCNAFDSTLQSASASVTINIGNDFVAPPLDSDGDGIPDSIDLCPTVASANNADSDGDGVGDACDKCPVTFNLSQRDSDGDGIADDCDPCDGNLSGIGVDGFAENEYGPALAVQNTATSAGDSTTGDENNSAGSELDNLHAYIDCDRLFVHIGGNLAIGASDSVDIFIDSVAQAGQNKLRFGNPAGLAGMSEVSSGSPGLTFETGFAPDYWIGLTNTWQTVNITAALTGTYAPLTASGTNPPQASLGQAPAFGDGTFTGGADGAPAIKATIDNSNTSGVVAGSGSGSGNGATTGIELSIPLSAIGNPGCDLKLLVILRDTTGAAGGDTLTNQTLPGIGGGAALGAARNVNFNTVPGSQQVTVSRRVVGPAGADLLPAALGRRFVASAAVYAPAPYTAQWLRNGVAVTDSARITGSTTPVLTIDPARQRDLGSYSLRVTTGCGTFTSPATSLSFCAADYNNSGGVSVQDIFDFLAAYFGNDLHADFNGSGGLSVQDIFDFLAAYFAGCA